MDTSDLQCLTSMSSNTESEKESSFSIQSKRAKFFATYKPQNFSLPDSIMYYIVKNPTSPEFYEKMIQTCKYFFFQNPILVIPDFKYFDDGKWEIFNGKRKPYYEKIPIDTSRVLSKLWFTNKLVVQTECSVDKKAVNQNSLNSLMPKLYQCDAKVVWIKNQTISFNDLSRLISSAENIYLFDLTVRDKNGSNVGIEKMIEVAVKAKMIEFSYNTSVLCVTSETMKELIKLPHFSKLDRLIMLRIPEAFDLETFYIFIKENKTTKFELSFDDSISEAYKIRLEEIIDEILATEKRDYKAPYIYFLGLDEEKYSKLEDIYYSH